MIEDLLGGAPFSPIQTVLARRGPSMRASGLAPKRYRTSPEPPMCVCAYPSAPYRGEERFALLSYVRAVGWL